MRARFDQQLAKLNEELKEMGAECEAAIAGAVKALFSGDKKLVQETIAREGEIDRMEQDIESLCMKLLLQQQPVAHDLRTISSAMKMITDMERIGDQAADIADLVTYTDLTSYVDNRHIIAMAEATIKMVSESVDAFVRRDFALAGEVIAYDDVVDELFVKIKGDLVQCIVKNPAKGEAVIDILMIAKYLERIGDHATNIAEWVEYSITGTHRSDAMLRKS